MIRRHCGTVIALLVFIFVILSSLSVFPFGTSSEAREAHIAQVILDSKNWILPSRAGLSPSKPPLQHWLSAAFGCITGQTIDETIARLPSSIAGLLILFMIGFRARSFSRVAFDYDSAVANKSFWLTFFILGTTYGFLNLLPDARVDMLFSLFVTLSWMTIFRRFDSWISTGGNATTAISSLDKFLFFVCCGFAVLAKGPLGFVLPCLIVWSSLYALQGFRSATRFFLTPHIGWLAFIAIAVPWYILASVQGDTDVIGRQLVFENAQRFLGGESVNSEAWWFYGPSFLRIAFPWSIFFILLCIHEFRIPIVTSPYQLRIDRVRILLHAYLFALLAGAVLFSLASGKRHSYLLPLFPLFALYLCLSTTLVYNAFSLIQKRQIEKVGKTLLVIFFVTSVAVGLCSTLYLVTPSVFLTLLGSHQYLEPCLLFAAPWFVFTVWFVILLFGRELFLSNSPRHYAIIGYVALFYLVMWTGLGIKSSMKGFPDIAKTINQHIPSNGHLIVLRDRNDELSDPILYYVKRPIQIKKPEIESIECLNNNYYLVRASIFTQLDSTLHSFESLAVLRQPVDVATQNTSRDLQLFHCNGV